MSILIIGDSFSFPDGNAATNRVHTYAKGFYENSKNVYVISFGSRYNNLGNGMINGIEFYHPFGQRKRSGYFIVRRWYKFIKYFKTIRLIKKIAKNENIEAIIVYSQELSTHLFTWFLSGITRSILIKECGEHPLQLYQKGAFKKQIGLIKLQIESHLNDGILCISQFLVEFHKNLGLPHNQLLHVPSTVDIERFKASRNSPLAFQYILYCGSLTLIKDGVNILIESFARITEKYPEINLVLIGKGNSLKEEFVIKDLVERLNISNKVFFLGQLSRTEIPAYLNNAKILALARPKSIVADAGFPSKLTEYLATGVPVVVTEVGDIPEYLTDKENAFLSKPDSVNAFAEKMKFVLDNYQFAIEVALKGKELTNTVFNYNFQAKRIIDYIDAINN